MRRLDVIYISDYSYNISGLGTDINIEEVLNKAQKEILQYFTTAQSKFVDERLNKLYDDDYKDEYHFMFDNMTRETIYLNYEYLFIKSDMKDITEIKKQYDSKDLLEIVSQLKESINMNPYVVMIPAFRSIPNLKIVKIVDESWFPYMNIKKY